MLSLAEHITARMQEALVEAEEMSHHEPIILNKEDWADAHGLVQHSLNRLANNAHDDREKVHGLIAKLQADTAEKFEKLGKDIERRRGETDARREGDLEKICERYDPLAVVVATLQTRVLVYGTVAGFLAGGCMTALLMYLFKGH